GGRQRGERAGDVARDDRKAVCIRFEIDDAEALAAGAARAETARHREDGCLFEPPCDVFDGPATGKAEVVGDAQSLHQVLERSLEGTVPDYDPSRLRHARDHQRQTPPPAPL